MKINVTKKEYQLLLEMLAIADWVMHSRSVDEDAKNVEHKTLKNKFYALYKDFEAEDLIEPGDDSDAYYEKDELLNKIFNEFMKEYEDDVFWDELTHKLAVRDVISTIGDDAFESLEGIERMEKVSKAQDLYAKEFEKHGLACVKIEDSKTNH